MNLLEIESFEAVLKYGNISKAAEQLFITQPALSLRISNLEKELGYSLFIRKKGNSNITLTNEGKYFINIAEQFREIYLTAYNLKTNLSTHVFSLSSLNSISSSVLPEICYNFLKIYPEISLKTDDLSSVASYNAVENRIKDISLITDEQYSKKAICKSFYTEDIVLICNKNYKADSLINIRNLDVRKEVFSPWCLEFEQWHDHMYGKNSKPLIKIETMKYFEYFLSKNNNWAFVPSLIAEYLCKNDNIQQFKTNQSLPKRSIKYITHSEGNNILTEKFIECYKEVLVSHQEIANIEIHI